MAEGTTSAVQVAIACETAPGERRVAATPETCKKLIALGAQVRVQRGAGQPASFVDDAYVQAGAEVVEGTMRCLMAPTCCCACSRPSLRRSARCARVPRWSDCCAAGRCRARRGDPGARHHRVPAGAAAAHHARAGDGRAQFAGRHGRLQGGADRRATGAALLPDADHGGRHDPPVEGADRRRRRGRPAGDRHRQAPGRAGRRLRRAPGNARADRIAGRQVPRPGRQRRGRGRLCAPAHRRGARRTAAPSWPTI